MKDVGRDKDSDKVIVLNKRHVQNGFRYQQLIQNEEKTEMSTSAVLKKSNHKRFNFNFYQSVVVFG